MDKGALWSWHALINFDPLPVGWFPFIYIWDKAVGALLKSPNSVVVWRTDGVKLVTQEHDVVQPLIASCLSTQSSYVLMPCLLSR